MEVMEQITLDQSVVLQKYLKLMIKFIKCHSQTNQCFNLKPVKYYSIEIEKDLNKWFYINSVHYKSYHVTENIYNVVSSFVKHTPGNQKVRDGTGVSIE